MYRTAKEKPAAPAGKIVSWLKLRRVGGFGFERKSERRRQESEFRRHENVILGGLRILEREWKKVKPSKS
jgi:hypothetical protein